MVDVQETGTSVTEPDRGRAAGRSRPRSPRIQVQTTIRIDPQAYDHARRAANREGSSLNAWIVQAVDEKLSGGARGE